MDKLVGFIFLACYIFAVGVGSFLQKFVMDKITPFQLEVITAAGMVAISVPALLIAQKNLNIPFQQAPLSLLVGLLFSLGSFVYVLAVSKLPVGIAAPVSTGYIVVAVVLSVLFLKEPMTLLKAIGILFSIVGVAILSLH